MKTQYRVFLIGTTVVLALAVIRCSKVSFQPGAVNESLGLQSSTIKVSASRPNPPLDLIFVVDNSGSMLDHQINLGNAFANIFTSNTGNLSSFDVNLYLISTTSTLGAAELSWLPKQNSVPNLIDPLHDLSGADWADTPGSVFAIWNNVNGSVQQFTPVSVLGYPMGGTQAPTPFLHISAQGDTPQADYLAQINNLTALFQSRLAFLNPTYTQSYEPLTDISSGLCTMARVLRHASDQNFIRPGESAAFVIVSDDNDRLNVRNPNNSQCIEALAQGSDVLSGSCGNYVTTFDYTFNSLTANGSYTVPGSPNNSANFAFSIPATSITYSAPSENCAIQYQTTSYNYNLVYTPAATFNYSLTYTPATTYNYSLSYTASTVFNVSYFPCDLYDGICSGALEVQTQQQVSIPGTPTTGTNGCPANVTGMLSATPDTAKPITCSISAVNHGTKTGADANSNGSQCSSTVLQSVPSGAVVNSCTITPQSYSPQTLTGTDPASNGSQCSSAVLDKIPSGAKIDGCTIKQQTYSPQTLTGTDSASNGSQCSSAVLGKIPAGATYTNCTITAQTNTQTANFNNAAVGTCENYCKNNPGLANCGVKGSIGSGTPLTGTSSLLPGAVTCSTLCPASGGYCSSAQQSITQYLESQFGPNVSCTANHSQQSASVSVSSGTATCGDILSSSEHITGHSGTFWPAQLPTDCANATIEKCIDDLTGTSSGASGSCSSSATTITYSGATQASQHTDNLAVSCETDCSKAGSVCPNFTGSVGAYFHSLNLGSCADNAPQSQQASFSVTSASADETCNSLCSSALNGLGCDGHGFGVTGTTAGLKISDYITSLGGSNCSVNAVSSKPGPTVVTTAISSDPSGQPETLPVCADPGNPVFFPSGTLVAGQPAITYTAGDANHLASDFKQYIQTQAQNVFGAANMPALGVITHLASDTNITGTDVGQDYIDLAQNYFNSDEISSIEGDYVASLSSISNFIVKSAQNNFVLPIPSGSTLFSVSILSQGSNTWKSINSSEWSLAGQTLSIGQGANLQIGDQIMYTYRSSESNDNNSNNN